MFISTAVIISFRESFNYVSKVHPCITPMCKSPDHRISADFLTQMILPAFQTSFLDERPCYSYVHVAPFIHRESDFEKLFQGLFLAMYQFSPNSIDSFYEKLSS